jgi:hypothetical protein
MVELRAITEIWKSSGRMIPTGKTDREGNPVLRVETVVIEAGSTFEAEDDEAEKLIANGAAVPADEGTEWTKEGN